MSPPYISMSKEICFPEDVFHLIKSFTKPNIWTCECCYEEHNMKKCIPKSFVEGEKYCDSCVENFQCADCLGCSTLYDLYSCENCGWDNVCEDCLKNCEGCGITMCGECFRTDGVCANCVPLTDEEDE